MYRKLNIAILKFVSILYFKYLFRFISMQLYRQQGDRWFQVRSLSWNDNLILCLMMTCSLTDHILFSFFKLPLYLEELRTCSSRQFFLLIFYLQCSRFSFSASSLVIHLKSLCFVSRSKTDLNNCDLTCAVSLFSQGMIILRFYIYFIYVVYF